MSASTPCRPGRRPDPKLLVPGPGGRIRCQIKAVRILACSRPVCRIVENSGGETGRQCHSEPVCLYRSSQVVNAFLARSWLPGFWRDAALFTELLRIREKQGGRARGTARPRVGGSVAAQGQQAQRDKREPLFPS